MNNVLRENSIISFVVGFAFILVFGTASIASGSDTPLAPQVANKTYLTAESQKRGEKEDSDNEKKGYGKKLSGSMVGISAADTDNDDRVSKDEHARHSQLMFETMDSNKDGYIDRNEAGRSVAGISAADTDNDDRVSKDEHARHSQLMFEMMDSNKDGDIDRDEAGRMTGRHDYGKEGTLRPRNQFPYPERYRERLWNRELQHMKPMGE